MRPSDRSILASLPKALPAVLCLALLALHPNMAGAVGTDLAATQPAAPDPGTAKVLANGTIRFTTPDDWDEITASGTDLRGIYALHDHASFLSVEILPVDAKIGPESFNAIMRSLRQTRVQRKEEFIEKPTAEKDDRFLLRIHEKYHTVVKVDDKPTERVATQIHLYRQVGARIMMVTILSTAESDDELKQAQSAGEAVALSATFVRPSRKK